MTIGLYIKKLRIGKNVGQRELARKLGISAPYLNDIENGKRNGPSKEIIKKISYILEANLEYLYDLAGKDSKRIPPDIPEIIKKYDEVTRLLRVIKKHNLSSTRIKELIRFIEKGRMKAIS